MTVLTVYVSVSIMLLAALVRATGTPWGPVSHATMRQHKPSFQKLLLSDILLQQWEEVINTQIFVLTRLQIFVWPPSVLGRMWETNSYCIQSKLAIVWSFKRWGPLGKELQFTGYCNNSPASSLAPTKIKGNRWLRYLPAEILEHNSFLRIHRRHTGKLGRKAQEVDSWLLEGAERPLLPPVTRIRRTIMAGLSFHYISEKSYNAVLTNIPCVLKPPEEP